MIGLVATVSAVALVILVLIGIAMFFDVAMGDGRRIVLEREAETRRWSPPFIRGGELLDWARSRASGIVRDVVARAPGPDTAGEITSRLNRGAAEAMLPGARPREASRPVACPQAGQGLIGVSAPEAIQIATYLRATLSRSGLKRFRDGCRRNADILSDRTGLGITETPCSLQGDDCVCLAYSDRPMECRPLHAAVIAEKLHLDFLAGATDSSLPAARIDTISEGLREGLARSLERAGLDGGRYELHGALVAALDDPDAAEHWAAGGDVFRGCRVVGPGRAKGTHLQLVGGAGRSRSMVEESPSDQA